MATKIVERAMNHIIKSCEEEIISERNKKLFIDFINKLRAKGHSKGKYSSKRLIKYCYALMSMAKILKKDFDKATKEEIDILAADIRDKYKGETPRDYLVMLRIFMKYIKELEGQEFGKHEFPKIVKDIEPGSRPRLVLVCHGTKQFRRHSFSSWRTLCSVSHCLQNYYNSIQYCISYYYDSFDSKTH